MKVKFDTVSAHCSKFTTRLYSTSFSLGIQFLNREFHGPIYAIYGFVRLADEIVDSFHDYDKATLLYKFKADTYDALEQGISLNPILNSFQETVNKYNIDIELIDTFLASMEMDLQERSYTNDAYKQYILGSAEVVGLMCLKVFTKNNNKLYQQLKPAAMRLGAAFQKVNFLRDAKADYEELGRTYFPHVSFSNFSKETKRQIEAEIEEDFAFALDGIKQLPAGSRRGVYLAYFYYKKLFNKIKSAPPEKILKERIRISNGYKLLCMFNCYVRHQFNVM